MSETHSEFGPAYYCFNQNANFEKQEATRNNDECPWCGEEISEIFE